MRDSSMVDQMSYTIICSTPHSVEPLEPIGKEGLLASSLARHCSSMPPSALARCSTSESPAGRSDGKSRWRPA